MRLVPSISRPPICKSLLTKTSTYLLKRVFNDEDFSLYTNKPAITKPVERM